MITTNTKNPTITALLPENPSNEIILANIKQIKPRMGMPTIMNNVARRLSLLNSFFNQFIFLTMHTIMIDMISAPNQKNKKPNAY